MLYCFLILMVSMSGEVDLRGIDEVVEDGKDGQSGGGVDGEFGTDVAAVGSDGVD